MLINIRRNCFETNSSSMHSIVVTKNDEKYTPEELDKDIYVRSNGEWSIWNEDNLDFGRSPFQMLTTFERKFQYAIAEYCGGYNDSPEDDFEMLETIAKKYLNNLDHIKLPDDYHDWNDNDIYYGYIDHESAGLLKRFLKEENISLEEFLINKKYIVIIDGDEYFAFEEAKKSGIINTDNIEKEFPDPNWYEEY